MINGEFPGIPDQKDSLSGVDLTIRHLWETPADKVYSFQVSEAVREKLIIMTDGIRKRTIEKDFTSLEMIESVKKQ